MNSLEIFQSLQVADCSHLARLSSAPVASTSHQTSCLHVSLLRETPLTGTSQRTGKEHSCPCGFCLFSGGILTQSKKGAALCYQPPSICLGDAQEAFPDQSLASCKETMKLLPKRSPSISTAAIRATTLPQAQLHSNLLISIIFFTATPNLKCHIKSL